MKKLIAVVLSVAMALTLSISAFAAPSQTKTNRNSEFGTLTGYQEYIGKILGRKNINYSATTTNTSPLLIARVDIADYITGATVDGDGIQLQNTRSASYYCDCHSSQANSKSISSFGTHEARGRGSLVVYTGLINLN